MKRVIYSFLLLVVYFLLLFNMIRISFLVYYSSLIHIENIPASEILSIFFHAFLLDIATASYLMVIPVLCLVIQAIRYNRFTDYVLKAYTLLITFLYVLTGVGEMGIYSEWKTKLNYKVIKYFMHPDEIYNSSGSTDFFILLTLFLILFSLFSYVFLKFFFIRLSGISVRRWQVLIFSLASFSLLIPGMRGGIQPIPVNQSQCYYSKFNILNIAAVNNLFNLYVSVFENLANYNRNPYIFMKTEQSKEVVSSVYKVKTDTTEVVLRVKKPNIVLIILESWSADLIESLGGEPGITPEFRKLEKEGILFDQILASGARSEQGMASIFSGFPAHPISSVTVQPDKFVKLPSLVQQLKSHGYFPVFYFGGQLIYGNMKSYIHFNDFERITEIYDFPDTLPRGKLGIHDQYTLDWMLRELDGLPQPFFASLFTLSTHSPWDQPFAKPLKWGKNENEYINAAYYTDHCLGSFFREAAGKAWYDSTLFILVADHSHNSYKNWHPHSREYHRIPMLFAGPAIKPEYRNTKWAKMGNQHDLPVTLLHQLGISSGGFRWSKDLFNPYTQDFAYFTTDDGLGWVRPYATFTWDAGPDYMYWSWFVVDDIKDTVLTEGKAYLQEVFRDYLEK